MQQTVKIIKKCNRGVRLDDLCKLKMTKTVKIIKQCNREVHLYDFVKLKITKIVNFRNNPLLGSRRVHFFHNVGDEIRRFPILQYNALGDYGEGLITCSDRP